MYFPHVRTLLPGRAHDGVFLVMLTLGILAPYCSAQTTPAADSSATTAARADSVMLGDFLALPEDVQKDRIKEGKKLREKAEKNKSGPDRVDILEGAAQVDPSNTRIWLDLSQTYAWMGYPAQADKALSSVRMNLKLLQGKEKKELAVEYSLARAWLEYEKGNFFVGENWAASAIKWKAGLRGNLIEGLTQAARVKSEAVMFEYVGVFRPLDSNTNRKRNVIWISRMWAHFNNIDWSITDIWGYKEESVKFAEHEMTRGRDFGLIFEANGHGVRAAREYEKFLKYLPIKEGGWLRKIEVEIPGALSGFPPMPFWVNEDDGYVTGSMLAYLAHCYDRLEKETDPARRGRWAAHLVRFGAAALPRYPKHPWIHMWRGDACLVLDLFKEAEEDITTARARFEALGITEPALNPIQGHVLLLEKNYRDALPLLEQGALDYPENASVWADLGVARVMNVGREPAREAFDLAIELDPGLSSPWRNRGLLNMQDGRFQEALQDLETAAGLDPDNEQIREDLIRVGQMLK